MPKTIRQSVQRIAKSKSELEVATIVAIDVLARDANNVVTSVAPSITVNLHGKSGLQRVELSSGIDPLELNIGDQMFVTRVQDRYIGVAPLPISNRTQGGGESEGTGEAVEFMSEPQNVSGLIAGSQLELAWQPVQGADYYEIWASESADPDSDGAHVVARTPNTTWVGKGDGQFFDDGVYYAVVPHSESGVSGRAGAFSPWLQPAFAGNYALGILSKNQTTGIGGSLVVTKSASITRADFTSLDNPQTWNIDVCDPTGAHTTALFAVNEILRAVDTSGNALWMKVTATKDMGTYWRYTVNKQSPSAGTNRTIPSGSQVLNYGTSGQGTFAVSADGTFGAGTLWTIFTHAGSPWSATTAQVYANSSGQIVAGAGDVLIDANGIAFDEGSGTPNSLRWYDFDAVLLSSVKAYGDITGGQASFHIEALGNVADATIGAITLVAQVGAGLLTQQMTSQGYWRLYGSAGIAARMIIGSSGNPVSNIHIVDAAPSLRMEDSTASAKGLLVSVNANKAVFEEIAGTDIMVLDLANTRVGIANAAPSVELDVTGAGLFSGALTTNGAFTSPGIDDNANAVGITIDSTERVILTGTSTINHAGMNTILQGYSITTTAAAVAGASFGQFSADTRGSQINLSKSRNTSIALGAIVSSGDTLGQILFTGDDGNTFDAGATIRAIVDGTPGDADMPTRLEFLTSADGSATPTLRLTISSTGLVTVAGAFTSTGAATFSSTLAANGNVTVGDGINIILNTTTGTKIGTGTTQKLGFFNATPVAQQGATIDLGVALSNLGLRAAGTEFPISTSGAVEIIGTTPFGYGSGAGGTVTQLTNKSTGVTLNKVVGTITMNGAALAANTTVTFTLTNSTISNTDLLILNHTSGGTAGAYMINAQVAAGSATINVRNVTAGSLSEAIVIRFAIINGVTA